METCAGRLSLSHKALLLLFLPASLLAWWPTPHSLNADDHSPFPASKATSRTWFVDLANQQGSPSGLNTLAVGIALDQRPLLAQCNWSLSRLDSLWRANWWTTDVSYRVGVLGTRGRLGFEQQQSPGWNSYHQWMSSLALSALWNDEMALGLQVEQENACTQWAIAIQWKGGEFYQMELQANIAPKYDLTLVQSLRVSPSCELGMTWQTAQPSLSFAMRLSWDHFMMKLGQQWHPLWNNGYQAHLLLSSHEEQP